MGGAGAGDQRLRRHAAGIDAGAAEELALDQRHLHALFDHPGGKKRAGLAGADNDGVEAFHATAPDDQHRADDGDGILDESGRQILAEGGGKSAADGGATICADDGADHAGNQPAEKQAAGGADRGAGQRAR